jgi:hypothetical protein
LVNLCLRYILRTWWPKIISNKDLRKATGQEDINLEIKKKLDGLVRNTKGCLIVQPSGKQKERKTKEQLEKICYQRSG